MPRRIAVFLARLSLILMLALISQGAFAQTTPTYGTSGYAPGAWKPGELANRPKTEAKPFNAHDLSGVWSTPTRPGYFERHSLNDKWLDIKDKSVPDQMRSDTHPPPMTPCFLTLSVTPVMTALSGRLPVLKDRTPRYCFRAASSPR